MATADLLTIYAGSGSGGIFKLDNRVSGQIPAGVTGNILTLTAVAGQIAKLTLLSSSTVTDQSGISVIRDGVTCLSGTLSRSDTTIAANTFFISTSYYSVTPSGNGPKAKVDPVYGSIIIINKNAGNTTQAIDYVVEYGVVS